MTNYTCTPSFNTTPCGETHIKNDHIHTISCITRRPSCDAPQIQTNQFPVNEHPFPKYNVHRVHIKPPVPLKDKLVVFINDIGVVQLQEITGRDNGGWVVYRCTNLRVKYTETWIAVRPIWVAGKGWLSRRWKALTWIFPF
jgi:hypothetical protein